MFGCKFATRPLIAFAVTAVLAACASVPSKPPEEIVKERATSRWQAMQKNDFKAAYELMTPAYRAVTNFETHRAKIGGAVQWAGAEVTAVVCEPEKCVVTVRIDAKPVVRGRFGDTISTHMDETWLLDGGQWWFFQK